jgi:Dolichyl-phosphate-mannose-protein mannosyltransferase
MLARQNLALLALIAVFVAFACYYSVVTPIFESPDEFWHFNFVREVAVNRGLPVVNAAIKQPFAHEGLQPPLYYTLGAGLIAWMDPQDLQSLPAANPYARIGEPAYGTNDNRNAYLHTSSEAFPYHGLALAVHLLRLYSILLGAATVIFTYLLGREMFAPLSHPSTPKGADGVYPSRPTARMSEQNLATCDEAAAGKVLGKRAALLSASFVAFLPQFLFISGSISNDNLATTLSAAALWRVACLFNHGLGWRRALVVGLVVGGASITKLSAAALVPLVLLVVAYLAWREGAWKLGIRFGATFLAVVALVAGWWYLRNVQLYGEVLPFTPLAALVGARPSRLDLWRWLSAEGEGLRLSAWGVFGWFNIAGSPLFYRFYDTLAVLGLAGAIFALARRRGISVRLAVLPIWIALCIAALWSYSSMIVSTQGRLLFPALSAWAVLWAWGILALAPFRLQPLEIGVLSGALAISAVLTPPLFIAPAYAPAVVAENELPANITRLDRRFENGVEWLGMTLDRLNVHAGESFNVTVYERVPVPGTPRAALFIHLVNSAEVIIAQRDSLIGSGNMRMSEAPYIIRDSFRVQVPVTAPAPDVWHLVMGMYDPASGRRYVAFDPEGRTLGDSLTYATLQGRVPAEGDMSYDFNGRVSLVGVSLSRMSVSRGNPLWLTLTWRGGQPERDGYHVFAHALGEGDHIWAAADAALNAQPEIQLDLHWDAATPPGVYPIELGVYPAPNGDRLEIFDAQGQDVGDRLFLGPVRVTP